MTSKSVASYETGWLMLHKQQFADVRQQLINMLHPQTTACCVSKPHVLVFIMTRQVAQSVLI